MQELVQHSGVLEVIDLEFEPCQVGAIPCDHSEVLVMKGECNEIADKGSIALQAWVQLLCRAVVVKSLPKEGTKVLRPDVADKGALFQVGDG
jgi:hypothetical protein